MARRPPKPWVQRFKPNKFLEVCGNSNTVHTLQHLARQPHALPHLILSGPVGCGKSTLTHCLVQNARPSPAVVVTVYSYDDIQESTFRDRMHFLVARLQSDAFAFVIVENVDSMSSAFQMAAARLFEDPILQHHITFVFTCTHAHLLLPVLTSRCFMLHLASLDDAAIYRLARRVAHKAKMPLSNDAIVALRYIVSGDARALVRSLETLYMLGGTPKITAQDVIALFDVPPPHHMVDALVQCLHGESNAAWQILQKHILMQGYSVGDCYTAIRRLLLDPDGARPFVANKDALNTLKALPEDVRMRFVKTLSRTHMMAVQGVASHIQLTGFLASLAHKKEEESN